MREATEWHRVVFFGRLAGVAAQYLTKGAEIFVEGRLKTRKWTDNGIDRYATEIVADRLLMLGARKSGPSRPDASLPADDDMNLDGPAWSDDE
ncbi:hypothetical protein WI25_05945 [Burkholderia cepacia]|nr:hypothetical protein WI25_05945 [Burkholderia cepacia]